MTKKYINEIVKQLSTNELLSKVYHKGIKSTVMPSVKNLKEIMDDLKSVIFPGYFGNPGMETYSIEYHIGATLDRIYSRLKKEIKRGYCFSCAEEGKSDCSLCGEQSEKAVEMLIKELPKIRHLLGTDALAAYEGDPASRSVGETIFSYPSIKALTNYRISHELFILGVPLIPRIISELAHSETGIDIHPGAEIGEKFFIDHGTGVVIGETCIIGRNVRLYQGVTLGAKSFPLDEQGNPIKGIARHPVVEDDVVIYSGATILGRITIGRGSQIGGNVWLTKSVEPGSVIRASF
ncbi:MAG: serine acetyltransferase [Spirochaetes bacterium]|nr:serine acetyltransferase [Spirochaetota bacterium]